MAGYTSGSCEKCQEALNAAWKLPEENQPYEIIAECGHVWTRVEFPPNEALPSDLKTSIVGVPESPKNQAKQ